ncbi:MAG: hypothetical protein P1V51_22415 [Deltaproteobacteria bacterium]|nr:hypothetical protein [Deltaproteobacteria bacterium]
MIAALIAAVASSGGYSLYLGAVERRCTVVEMSFACGVLETYAPALAAGCEGRRQLELVMTATAAEVLADVDLIIPAMEAATGITEAQARELLGGSRIVHISDRVGSDAQCPDRRVTIRKPTGTGCLAGLVSRDGAPARWVRQCCGPLCVCVGVCCATVPQFVNLASEMDVIFCSTCAAEARCQSP